MHGESMRARLGVRMREHERGVKPDAPLSRAAAAQVGQVDAASLRLLLLHQSADYTHSHGSPPAVRQ